MTNLIIGLKIDSYNSFSECARIVRRYHAYGFAELKERIEKNDYVLCYSCTDDNGVKNVINCYDNLVRASVKVSLYELDGRPTTIELLRNRNRMFDDISDEIDGGEY